ncbi:MAG: hypothetical protein RRZ66_07490 [Bacteroidales bacterium]
MRIRKPLSEVRNGGYFRCPHTSNVLRKIGTRQEYTFGRNVAVYDCSDKNGYVHQLRENPVERATLEEIRLGFYNAGINSLPWK